MQLIEQRLEFGVGDFIAGGTGRGWRSSNRCRSNGVAAGGLCLDGVQRIEQLLELVVGNVFGRCRLSRLRRGRRSGHFVGRRRFGQASQCSEQFRRCRRDVSAFAHFAKHGVDRVQCFEHHVHELGVDPALTFAQDVEDVLGDMAAFHQLVELEEASAPFYSVKTAKNCIEQVSVIRSAFQLDQLFGQLLQNLAGLNQKILKDFFIGAEAHWGGCS
jgi:hypothetical protein